MDPTPPSTHTLPDGTEPNTANERTGYFPLHDSIVLPFRRSTNRIQTLLRAWPDAVRVRLPNGAVALHLAAAQYDSESFVRDILTTHPPAIQIETADGRLPLDYAIAGKANIHVVNLLLDAWEESRNRIDAKGVSFLAKAISNARDAEIVQAFCTKENLSLADANGRTILHHAITEHKAQHLDLILRVAPHLTSQPDAAGCLPLHTAVGIPHFPSVYLEKLIQLFPEALKSPCTEVGNLPLHQMLCHAGPLPQATNIRYLVKCYPEALKVRNGADLIPLQLFQQTSGHLLWRTYDKAQNILCELVDPKLPLHDVARWCHFLSPEIRNELLRTRTMASNRRDADGWYAWQVAASNRNASLSLVYDLLRLSPLTLQHTKYRVVVT